MVVTLSVLYIPVTFSGPLFVLQGKEKYIFLFHLWNTSITSVFYAKAPEHGSVPVVMKFKLSWETGTLFLFCVSASPSSYL